VTIGAGEPVTRAARLMFDQRVKRLPVTSDDGTLIGIVTIEGTPETNRAGHDIIDAVRHMAGVVFVRDRLSYPDGSSRHPRIAT
jgi:CBS-domain-containing membrane protein